MEYRGVDIASGQQLFHVGPMRGTNNLGEFLAVVHGLARLVKERRSDPAEPAEPMDPIYTDSITAIAWVRRAAVRSTLVREATTDFGRK